MKNVYKNQSGPTYRQAGFALGKFLLEFVQSIVLALSVFVLIYLFVAQPNEVQGSSMYPNFLDKEFLLTEKISYEFGEPKRGDVVIFKAPESEPCSINGCEYIKRVIGLPGDKVMLKDGEVYLNGKILEQSFLPDGIKTEGEEYMTDGVEITVPTGQYLCFGDNRPNSRDGRAFGPIDRKSIIGKALLKYWPISSISLVPKVEL